MGEKKEKKGEDAAQIAEIHCLAVPARAAAGVPRLRRPLHGHRHHRRLQLPASLRNLK